MVMQSLADRGSVRRRAIAAAVTVGLLLGSVASALAGQAASTTVDRGATRAAADAHAIVQSTATVSTSAAPHLMDARRADAFDHPASTTVQPVAKHVAAPAPAPKPVARYVGTNHVWIPWLGLSRSVQLFPCSRSRDPDNYVYRWGCAGSNNVYLLGHAYSVFKGLHDAYTHGRLAVGLKVIYADGAGRVTVYRITQWRVVSPFDSAWAIASQPRPSMTLQTCVGPTGNLRLNVRLVADR
jgi:hypothetical protein